MQERNQAKLEETVGPEISVLSETSTSETLPSIAQRLIVLEMMYLLDKPMSGYEIYKQLRLKFGLRTSYGTLYPWLRQLESADFIKAESVVRQDRPISGQKKRVYCLTETGKSELRKSLSHLAQLTSLLNGAFEPSRSQLDPQIAIDLS